MNNVVFIYAQIYKNKREREIGPYTCTAFINTETALRSEHIARTNAFEEHRLHTSAL